MVATQRSRPLGRARTIAIIAALAALTSCGSDTPVTTSDPGPTPCSVNAPSGYCPGERTCVHGACSPYPCSPEHASGACPSGRACSPSGHCLAADTCAEDIDCSKEHFCGSAGACLPLGYCIADDDCRADGRYCAASASCLPVGECGDERDCAEGEACMSAHHCHGVGGCDTYQDCPPGHACQDETCVPAGLPCTTNELTTLGCESNELWCCPAGEACCYWPEERCSTAGVCIWQGQCVTRDDCPPGAFACVDYACVPQRSCSDGCLAGEACDWGADACVPVGTCADPNNCGPEYMCSSRFDCVLVGACLTFWEKLEQPISAQCTFVGVYLHRYGEPWSGYDYALYLDPRDGSNPVPIADAAWGYDAGTSTLTLIGDACVAAQDGSGVPIIAVRVPCEE